MLGRSFLSTGLVSRPNSSSLAPQPQTRHAHSLFPQRWCLTSGFPFEQPAPTQSQSWDQRFTAQAKMRRPIQTGKKKRIGKVNPHTHTAQHSQSTASSIFEQTVGNTAFETHSMAKGDGHCPLSIVPSVSHTLQFALDMPVTHCGISPLLN